MPEADKDKELIEYLQGILSEYFTIAYPHFERKAYIQRMFDGDIDPGEFGTMSEIYIPFLRSEVKKAMPEIMEYVFPNTGFTSLRPLQGGIPFDSVRKFEELLDHVLQYKMRVKKYSVPIIQDGLKFGAGYGIVEKSLISAEESSAFSVIEGGKFTVKQRGMRIAATPKLMPRLRYLEYEQVIPSPDGGTPDEASCVIVIDYIREDEFRDLYRSQAASNEPIYKGDPDKIIEDSLSLGIGQGLYPHTWNIQVMAGETTSNMQSRHSKVHEIAMKHSMANNKHAPITVPVVKYFFKNEHIWVANGRTIIYHDEDSYETLRCPVLKASPDLDSNNWWALSDVAASRDMNYGINAYSNAMMDLLTQYLRPMIVYDQSRYGGSEAPRHQPWGVIPVNGKTTDAFSSVTPPPIAPGMLNVGETMKRDYNDVNHNPLGGQQTPGLVRGGSHAFESLLQTTNGPRELTGMIYDMGFIEPLIKQVMIHMQTLPQEEFEYVELKDRVYTASRISLSDIRYAFDVSTDLREKTRHGINERMAEITMYQNVYKNNPDIRQTVALERVIGDKDASRQLIATQEEREENIRRMQASMNPEKGMTQAEQAVAGGLGRGNP